MSKEPEQMLPTPETMRVVGVKSPNTLKRLIREEGFPEAYELMRGRKSWAASEVQSWLQQKMSSQRQEPS